LLSGIHGGTKSTGTRAFSLFVSDSRVPRDPVEILFSDLLTFVFPVRAVELVRAGGIRQHRVALIQR